MSGLSEQSIVYFEPEIHQALIAKAEITHQSISELINEVMSAALQEDKEDLAVFEQKKNEPTISYEELLADLKAHGKL